MPLCRDEAQWVWDQDATDPYSYPDNWALLEINLCPQALVTSVPDGDVK